MNTNDSPGEGPINDEQLQRMWVLGDRPIDISRKTGIPFREVLRRLKQIQQLIVEKEKVIRP